MVATDARRLEALMTPWVEDLGYELVRVTFMNAAGRGLIVQLMAERTDGTMSVDDCARLSRALSAKLDAADPIPGGYLLEVSSPGIERPLTKLKDFERFAGSEARVETTVPVAGQRRFRGVLRGVRQQEAGAGDAVVLEVGGEMMTIAFASIEKARLAPDEALPQARTGKGLAGRKGNKRSG